MDTQNDAIVARFEIRKRRYLDPEGNVVAPLPAFAQNANALIPLYRSMVLTRSFDAKAVNLQRTGRLGTYATSLGQEAASVGAASAMEPDDVLLPTYREAGAQILRGVKMVELLLYWGGDERGSNFSGPREDFPVCVPVASHALHAAGVAYAFKLRRQPRVAICIFGDGATSKGDVWESMNFAGVWNLPVIYIVCNNRWAISVPLERQTASETLAQKAIAAGFSGEQVDGNDIIAVRASVEEAISEARSGGGPRLVEALTYRLGDHTTADDASRYRSDDDVSTYWKEEPIARLRSYLTNQGVWSKQNEEQLATECQNEVEAAVEVYLATEPRPPETAFDCLYKNLPRTYARQQQALKEAPDA